MDEDKKRKDTVPFRSEYLKPTKVARGELQSSQVTTIRKTKNQIRRDRKNQEKLKLCNAFLNGDCDKGVDCRFSHDLQVFLAQKPPALPGICIFRSAGIECPYGITCRYNHEQTISKTEDNATILSGSNVVFPLKNVLSKETRTQLRKGTYDFSRAQEALNVLQKDRFPDIDKRSSSMMSKLDFEGKLYLAPLTTLGNLPFRRMCVDFGADVTCSEMALASNLLKGQQTEWALLKRHPSETFFGIQICGGYPDVLTQCAQLIEDVCEVDFIDVNLGCPLDAVCKRCGGASLLLKPGRMRSIAKTMSTVMQHPLTFKMRKGYYDDREVAHGIIPQLGDFGVSAITLHGRTREQHYTKSSDWAYIYSCSKLKGSCQFIGNGDIFSFTEWEERMNHQDASLDTCMIGRAALIKPWIFTEIKERRHWDISSSERLEMLKTFCSRGLEHWGSDERGVENTRRFLLEWLSFLYRYVPVGLLEVVPQTIHARPPPAIGRNELESLFMSDRAQDWIDISERLLGPVPEGFTFCPRHKSNAYT